MLHHQVYVTCSLHTFDISIVTSLTTQDPYSSPHISNCEQRY